jgi:hypothetical protein
MAEICLLHLVWKPLGVEPFRDFIASYKEKPPGVEHRLVIAFNGFENEAEAHEYRDLLGSVAHDRTIVSPPTQDLPVYFKALETFDEKYFCFLNSYSVILDEGWLAKLHRHLTSSNEIGIVGASGSYESYYTNLELERGPFSTSRFRLRRLAHDLPLLYQDYRTYANFPPFPNYHIRTNGFMIKRDVMLKLKYRRLQTKMDCFKFESGREGMTRQVMRMGLKPIVVGRDGRAYEKEQWCESGTFRINGQHNLLIADNHTRRYAEADEHTKLLIEQVTWGSWARREAMVASRCG